MVKQAGLIEILKNGYTLPDGTPIPGLASDKISQAEQTLLNNIEKALHPSVSTENRQTQIQDSFNTIFENTDATKSQAILVKLAAEMANGNISINGPSSRQNQQAIAQEKEKEEKQSNQTLTLLVAQSIQQAASFAQFNRDMDKIEDKVQNIRNNLYRPERVLPELAMDLTFARKTKTFEKTIKGQIKDIKTIVNKENFNKEELKDKINATKNTIGDFKKSLQEIRDAKTGSIFEREEALKQINGTIIDLKGLIKNIQNKEAHALGKDILKAEKRKGKFQSKLEKEQSKEKPDQEKIERLEQEILDQNLIIKTKYQAMKELKLPPGPEKDQLDRLLKMGKEIEALQGRIFKELKELNKTIKDFNEIEKKIIEINEKLEALKKAPNKEKAQKLTKELDTIIAGKDGVLEKNKTHRAQVKSDRELYYDKMAKELNIEAAKDKDHFFSWAKDRLLANGFKGVAENAAWLTTFGRVKNLYARTMNLDLNNDGKISVNEKDLLVMRGIERSSHMFYIAKKDHTRLYLNGKLQIKLREEARKEAEQTAQKENTAQTQDTKTSFASKEDPQGRTTSTEFATAAQATTTQTAERQLNVTQSPTLNS